MDSPLQRRRLRRLALRRTRAYPLSRSSHAEPLCMCGTSSSLPVGCGASLVPKVPCLPAAFIAPLARPHTHHSLLTVLGGCICSTLATCICTVLLHMLDTRWVCPSTMTPGLVHGRASDCKCSLACVRGSGIPVWILVPISLDLDDDHVRPRLSARGSASSGHPHVTEYFLC